jgi:hypothetical protein
MKTVIGLAILTVILLLASCTQPPKQSSQPDAAATAEASKAPATVVDSKPRLIETGKFGEDDRYVVAYKGNEFHIIAGESGLLAVKVPAPDDTTDWDSLWITFSPTQTRPRTHEEQGLTEPGAPLPYVPEDIAPLVTAAREMAALVAPGEPVLGGKPVPGRPRITVKGIHLSAIAANELALLARSERLSVTENLPLDEESIPADIKEASAVRLDRMSQKAGFTPAGGYYTFTMAFRSDSVYYLALLPAEGQPIVLTQFHIHAVDERESLYQFKGGKFTATYFTGDASLKGDIITEMQRRFYAHTLRFLDEGIISPQEPLAKAFEVFLLSVKEKEKLDAFSSDLAPRYKTPEDILKAFEEGLPF